MKKAHIALNAAVILCMMCPAVFAQEAGMKKALFIIAQNNFRDEEYLQPREILERSGIEVTVASSSLDTATGTLGAKVKPDILLSDANARDYSAIVFIGGNGSSQYWNDPIAHQLAQDGLRFNRIVAAICIAPVTLCRAGVLQGKRATVWSSESGQLAECGATYTGRPVEEDGLVITAAGPFAARDFGEKISSRLTLR